MEVGVVGLGKMGNQIAQKLSDSNFTVFGYDQDQEIINTTDNSYHRDNDLITLMDRFTSKKIIWLMVPSGEPTNNLVVKLSEIMSQGDIIIDGGNSYYKDSVKNNDICSKKGISFLDCGTSGGVWGLRNGFCLTIGGSEEVYKEIIGIFETLSTKEAQGGLFVGPSGSGHYVKMIHNGIEYGMMQSIAEGLEILKHKSEYKLSLDQIVNNWRRGSVVQSWLIDLIAGELSKDSDLEKFSSEVSDSGEGRWTIKESIDLSVPIPSIYASISQRFNSKNTNSYAGKILSAMRNAFGGHTD